jgi:hypothetical protein
MRQWPSWKSGRRDLGGNRIVKYARDRRLRNARISEHEADRGKMGFQSRSRSKKRKERILPSLSGSGVAIRHIVASEECNSQSAPIEENGESKKRKEKKAKPAGTEVKPIRKATPNLSNGGKLRRLLLTAHEAKCGETASKLFPLSSIVWLSRFWALVLQLEQEAASGATSYCDQALSLG